MSNLGMKRLREAALAFEAERSCLNCGSNNLQDLDRGLECTAALEGKVRCRNCDAIEHQEDTRNYLQEAVDIWDGKSMLIAGKEHIDALVGHCEELHLQVEELKETLASERSRMAAMRNEEPVYA